MEHRELTLNSRYAWMVARHFLGLFRQKKLNLSKLSIEIDPVTQITIDVSTILSNDVIAHRSFDRSFKWVLTAPMLDEIMPFYKALLFCDDAYQKVFRAYHCHSYPGTRQEQAAILKKQKRVISKTIRNSINSMVMV